MAKAKEIQELGEFKVGQKVLVRKGGMGAFRAIRPIDKITEGRGGTIYVDDMKFKESGVERGDGWHGANISIATDADRLSIAGSNAKKRLERFRWRELDDEKAIAIEKLLNENGLETR